MNDLKIEVHERQAGRASLPVAGYSSYVAEPAESVHRSLMLEAKKTTLMLVCGLWGSLCVLAEL